MAGMRQRKATMAEIAASAGVSVPTVSKVVNGRPDVAPATREKVEALLRDRGYQPPRAHPRGGAILIDLVFAKLDTLWATAILTGVEEAAHRVGTSVVVSAVRGLHRKRPDRRWLESLADRRSDGVLLILSDLSPDQQALLADLRIPVVILDPAGTPGPTVPSVGATNWNGGLAATEYLLQLGHRRIAVIGGPGEVLCSRARIDGYRAAMNRAGVRIPAGYVRHGDFRRRSGYRETLALLGLAQPPTAIFACADQMASGAYQALHERGLRVPDDVSVVGFDDLDQSLWAVPPLTTVRQPLSDMAFMATRMLHTMINGQEPENLRVELATTLVVRSSTAPPPPVSERAQAAAGSAA
jgi:LacI family transcriptional regulator